MERTYEKYFRQNRLPHLWCPGCGNGIAMKAIVQAIEKKGLSQDNTVIVSGIGCSSRASGYMPVDDMAPLGIQPKFRQHHLADLFILHQLEVGIRRLFPGPFILQHHAFAITTPNGVQILVHVGLDTVILNGEGITALHHSGDSVRAGTPILKLNLPLLQKRKINLISPVLVVNYEKVKSLRPSPAGSRVEAGTDTVLEFAV